MEEKLVVPPMGESITEAIVGELFRESHTFVKMDEELLELETDKVNQVIYAPSDGIVVYRVQTGDRVKVGDVLAEFDAKDSPSNPQVTPPQEVLEKPSVGIRRFGLEFLKKSESSHKSPEEVAYQENVETRKRLPRIRQVIAERLVQTLKTTAMLTTFNEVDMSGVIALRTTHQELFQKTHGVRLGFMSFFVHACIQALFAHPEVNSYLDQEDQVFRNTIDIGVAVSTDKGLMVPVLKRCDGNSLAQIEKNIQRFAQRAREGKIAVDDLMGGGFTITNGGVFGSLMSTPILNPSQAAILGMHTIQERPVAREGQVVIRPMMYLALSYDHRILDGKGAVSFLKHIKETLEDPSEQLLELS